MFSYADPWKSPGRLFYKIKLYGWGGIAFPLRGRWQRKLTDEVYKVYINNNYKKK
jgi:hypothetical protein